MGQSEVKFSQGEALDGTGLPVILSDPIDGVTVEQFWEMLENFIKNRKCDSYEVSYKVENPEEGVFITNAEFAVEGLSALIVGKLQGTITTKHQLLKDDNLLISSSHPNDTSMGEESLATVQYIRLHEDPLRLECWQDMKPLRSHGPLIKGLIEKSLKNAGIDVDILISQPSPTQEGKKSVLTGPLPEEWNLEMLYELRKRQARDDLGGVDFEGGVIIEHEGVLSTTYTTVSMSEDGKNILHTFYGDDETLTQVSFTNYETLLEDRRVETWSVQAERREGGKSAQGAVNALVNNMFKLARGEDY